MCGSDCNEKQKIQADFPLIWANSCDIYPGTQVVFNRPVLEGTIA